MNNPEVEWQCQSCENTGTYAELRAVFDHGVDTCCGLEVICVDDLDCDYPICGCALDDRCPVGNEV